jgi:APA family basic amino acid/polyamine antiporter
MTAKRISGWTATSVVIANMIGTGVFTSLGFQVASIRSDFALIGLWLVGGLVALCGALCYAELAAALRRSGGEYRFLARIYHPAAGFMAGWISATVGFAAPIALASMAFAGYFKVVIPDAPPVLLSLALVWLITAVHLLGVRAGAVFQNIATIVKVTLIVVLIIAGLLVPAPQPMDLSASAWPVLLSGPFAVSLVFVMYAYSGWNAATYITEEVRDPARNVPLALFIGTLAVIALYVLLNFVFLRTTAKDTLTGQLEVGLLAGQSIFGPTGGVLVSLLISFGLVASISAMTLVGPRVTKAMAEDLPALRPFTKASETGTPYLAMLFQTLIVTLLIVTTTFQAVLYYTQFSLLLCSFFTVLGVIVLRIREPQLERPYKVWLYPLTPIIFLAITLHMMVFTVQSKPVESLLGLLTMLAGLVLYLFTRGNRPKEKQESFASYDA